MTTRWGIAGTGRMAEMFVADFAEVADAVPVAAGSRSEGRATEFAAQHRELGMERGTTYRGLIEDPEVDIVYIATPHPQHHALALAAIEAGKPVLVEKAFTATLAGAEEVVAAARANGVFCMEAMWTRFLPVVRRARELIAEGAIGDVFMVNADFGAYRPFDAADRLFAPELGGGTTLDLGVYSVSFAQHFLGAPDSVTAAGRRFENGADASMSALLGYADGRTATASATLTSASGSRATVYGTRGSIEFGPRFHQGTRLVVRRNGAEAEELDVPATGRGYAHEIAEAGRLLAAGAKESDVMPLEETLAVMRTLEDILGQLGVAASEAPVDL